MRIKLLFIVMTTILSRSAVTAAEVAIENETMRVIVSPDENSFSLKRPIVDLTFVKKATFPEVIDKAEAIETEDAIWGRGQVIRLFHPGGWTTDIAVFSGCPFVHLSRTVANETKKPFEANAFEYLNFQIDLNVPQQGLRVLGTGGLTSVRESGGSYAFSAIADPQTRNGVVCGWLTHEQGVGVFFPGNDNDNTHVRAQIDFGHFQVDPGESRSTETLLIGYFDDARLGLEAYADSIVKHYDIQLAEKPGVYCTWYHAGASDERGIAENTEFAARQLKPFGLNVIQIDDKWQTIVPEGFQHQAKIPTTGPIKVFVDAKPNYSKGMAHTAKIITSHGMVAGIWFMPFAGNFQNPYFDPEIFAKNPDGTPFHDSRWSGTCIDMTNPKAERFVRDRVRRIYDWGYRYFKIDGMHTGAITYNTYVNTAYGNKDFGESRLHDPGLTHIQAYRKGLQILREEAPGTFILGCNVSQNMRSMGPAFGMIDGMRIGPDNGRAASGDWNSVVKGAWHGTNLYFLNGKVWHNDPDPVYPRASNPIDRARWMCSWMAVVGDMHTSSEQYATLPPERLDILRRCLPSHQQQARPVDLFETNQARIWHVQNDRLHIIGLFNWNENSVEEVVYDLDKLGLDSKKRYIGFEFWANQFSGPIQDQLKRTIAPASCQILVVRVAADHPQLLSTSRHITQGLIDVLDEEWNSATNTLSGKSAVVGRDPYQLRIAIPKAGNWKIDHVDIDDASRGAGGVIRLVDQQPGSARVVIETAGNREVHWTVAFK